MACFHPYKDYFIRMDIKKTYTFAASQEESAMIASLKKEMDRHTYSDLIRTLIKEKFLFFAQKRLYTDNRAPAVKEDKQ